MSPLMLYNFLWKSSIVGVYWSSNLSLRNREMMAVFPTLVEPKITMRWQFLAGMLNSFSDGDIFFIIFAPLMIFESFAAMCGIKARRLSEARLGSDWEFMQEFCRASSVRHVSRSSLGSWSRNYNICYYGCWRASAVPFPQKVQVEQWNVK